jgi:hypothetical protein
MCPQISKAAHSLEHNKAQQHHWKWFLLSLRSVQPLCEAYTFNEAGVGVCRNFLGSLAFTKLVKNPLFEVEFLW